MVSYTCNNNSVNTVVEVMSTISMYPSNFWTWFNLVKCDVL